MNRSFRSVAILAAVEMIAACPARAAAQSHDEADIRTVATRQADTWNRHDAKPTRPYSLKIAMWSTWSVGGGKGARSWNASLRRRSASCLGRARSR